MANEHPLDYLGQKEIRLAYTIAKIFHVILALSAIGGGITIAVCSKEQVNSYRESINGGMLAGGLLLAFLGPFLAWLSWVMTRVVFVLIHDMHLARFNIAKLVSLSQKDKQDNK